MQPTLLIIEVLLISMFRLINQKLIKKIVIPQSILLNARNVEVASTNGLNAKYKRYAICVETNIVAIANIMIEMQLQMNLQIKQINMHHLRYQY